MLQIADHGAAQKEVGVRRKLGESQLPHLEPLVDAETMVADSFDDSSVSEFLGRMSGGKKGLVSREERTTAVMTESGIVTSGAGVLQPRAGIPRQVS